MFSLEDTTGGRCRGIPIGGFPPAGLSSVKKKKRKKNFAKLVRSTRRKEIPDLAVQAGDDEPRLPQSALLLPFLDLATMPPPLTPTDHIEFSVVTLELA